MSSWEPSGEPGWPGRPVPAGSLGTRIAALRARRGWTQQQLADRLGISRVAVSHLETDLNVPGERTVALLAGCFRLEPHELVAGTSYPVAKADRLPVVVARWTDVELQLALCDRDLRWIERLADADVGRRGAAEALDDWARSLRDARRRSMDAEERAALDAALDRVRDASGGGDSPGATG